jgi:hypothetical protein
MFSFGVQQYVSDLYLTATNQPATLIFFFFRISNLLHILHIRLSFGIVHSIIIYSTISKITVRPREVGNRGNMKSRQRGPSSLDGPTSNHDKEAHRVRLCFLQPDLSLTEWVTLPARVSVHAPQVSLSPNHDFLSDLMKNTTLGY